MHNIGIAIAQFVSKSSSAGVVNVQFGFVPDFVIGIFDIDGTNPNIRIWANATEFAAAWTAALSLLITGSTGVITRDTSGIAVFNGATQITSAETADSDPKHVDEYGTVHSGDGTYTKPGIAIPADHQTASGKNLVIAFRRNK